MPPSKKRSAKKESKTSEPSEDAAPTLRGLAFAAMGENRHPSCCPWSVDLMNRLLIPGTELEEPAARLSEEKTEDTTLDKLRDLAVRAGQHCSLYLDARARFEATDYWYDKYMGEDDPRRLAFYRLLEGYKHVALAWVELGESRKGNRPYSHRTRIGFHGADAEKYVEAIEEHARHLEEEAWHAMTFPLVAAVFGEEPISDGRLVQMLCVFVVQTFLPEDLSVVTNCTIEEMTGMLQFGWKYLVTLGRLVTFADIRNVMTNASAYVAWSRCNEWRYAEDDVPYSTWGSVGEWFSRLQYFSTSGKTPSLKRSPNGMPTNALIDLVYQAKAMGKIGVDTPHWRKAIDPWLLVECARRPDVMHLATVNCSRLQLPLTASSRPEEVKLMLQAVGLRLQEPDAADWFKDTPFEARWHVCVLNLADPSGALVNVLSSAISVRTNTCHGEMERATQMYGSTFGCDSGSIAAVVPEWGYVIADEARADNTGVEVPANWEAHVVAAHIPRAFKEAHADAVELGVRQPMGCLSAATLTRPEERVAPIVVAQCAAMLRRSRFASSVEEAVKGSKQRTEHCASWQRGGPFAFRLAYCGAFSGLPSFGAVLTCEDLMFLTCVRDLGSGANAMRKLVDEAVVVRPRHTFAASGLVQRQVDIPGVGLWGENPTEVRAWIWECCLGIVELVFPRVEARNAKGTPFDKPRDFCLARCVDDSVVHSFCLLVPQACTSAKELRAKIKAALRQSLIAVATRLVACKQIANAHRPKLRSTLGWQWPDDNDPWRIIESVYFYEWPVRLAEGNVDALTASLAARPYTMPKAIARKYIAALEGASQRDEKHSVLLSTWKRCLDAGAADSRFCGPPPACCGPRPAEDPST